MQHRVWDLNLGVVLAVCLQQLPCSWLKQDDLPVPAWARQQHQLQRQYIVSLWHAYWFLREGTAVLLHTCVAGTMDGFDSADDV